MKMLRTAVLMVVVTTILLGIVYPLAVTGIAQIFFSEKANGQLIQKNGAVIGSKIIGQPFSAPNYFWPRPSAAGAVGYDAGASTGSNYGPTNAKLVDRVKTDVAKFQADQPGKAVPIDLVTTSASGLDPHISPAAAEFQISRVAKARGLSEDQVRKLVARNTEGRDLGLLGEPRVNVLRLNLDLDAAGMKNEE